MFLEQIIFNNSKKSLENKFNDIEVSPFLMMDAVNGIMNQMDLIFEDVNEEDVNNYNGVVHINGYTLREWINHINETFYNFELQSSLIYSICNKCLDDIKEKTG